ncbi:MAG: type 1 glutamine amidotransferase, partial [Atopostipes suicloacalis]|nr:type 1 glutamine amidotransferase [Atopostipes suicloacalis]
MAKVAVIMTDLFEESEFTSPKKAILDAGHSLDLIGPEKGETAVGKNGEVEVEIEYGIDEVKPEDYDALLIPGGYSPDKLRGDERFLDFIRHFSKERKSLFSICHAPQILASADVLRDVNATAVPRIAVDITNAGGTFINEAVVYDRSGLISSRTPDDLPQFNEAIID